MDRVRERREEYVITKRGTPVARLVPVGPGEVARTAFGWMKGSVTECGDVIGPSGIEWDALQGADGSEGPGR
jgi:antitoxin (DNA-binding transcriptional repressor) of toxin-antitoxin stability system